MDRSIIAAPNETEARCARVTKEGRKITYKVKVIQQPERARACGSGAKSSADRRPVDPPPIVELRIYEGEDAENDITFQFNANYFLFATLEQARHIAHGRVSTEQQHLTVLTGTPVAGLVYLDRPEQAGYFLFPDLSVRHEGLYRLSFNLYEEIKEDKDRDRIEDVNENADPAAHVTHRLEVKSKPFHVYSAKKFPGLSQSTDLSRTVAEQGCRVRIRRDVRLKKREGKLDESEPYAAPRPEVEESRGRQRRSSSASYRAIRPSPSPVRSDAETHHAYHQQGPPQGYAHSATSSYPPMHHAHPMETTHHPRSYYAGETWVQPPIPYAQPVNQPLSHAVQPPAPPVSQYSAYHQYPAAHPPPSAPPATAPSHGHGQAQPLPPYATHHHHQSRSSLSDSRSQSSIEHQIPPPLPAPVPHQSYQYAAPQAPPPRQMAAPHYPPPSTHYAASHNTEARSAAPASSFSPVSARMAEQQKLLPTINTSHQVPRHYLEPSSPASAGPSPVYSENTTRYRGFGSTDSAIASGKRSYSQTFDDQHTSGPMRAGARPIPGQVQGYAGVKTVDHDASADEKAALDRIRMSYKRADGRLISKHLPGAL